MAVLEFINDSNNTYKGMERTINYIKNTLKTELHLTHGKDCSLETAYDELRDSFSKIHL